MDSVKFNSINTDGFSRMASYNDTINKTPDIFENDFNHNIMDYIKQCPPLSGNKAIDIGCGTGDFSIYLANFGYNMTGVDSSENMLLVARNKLAILKKTIARRNEMVKSPNFMKDRDAKIVLSAVDPKIKFIKDDIQNLKMINDKFNVASALNFISYTHPAELPALIEKISGLIYSTGIAVFSFNTENYYKYRIDDKYSDKNFNCEIKYSYDQNEKLAYTRCEFNSSEAVKEPFVIDFVEYSHTLKDFFDLIIKNGLQIIKIFPNTRIRSADDGSIPAIREAIEATFSMPNGVKSIVLIAQKNQ